MPEQENKYNTWFEKWGYEIFVPLMMKTPGLIAYDRYKWTGFNGGRVDPKDLDYPDHLSLLYFENLRA